MIDIKFLHTIIDEEINDNLFKKLNHEQFFNIIEKCPFAICWQSKKLLA